MLERLGYFVTESSEHFAEYVPWFKRDRAGPRAGGGVNSISFG